MIIVDLFLIIRWFTLIRLYLMFGLGFYVLIISFIYGGIRVLDYLRLVFRNGLFICFGINAGLRVSRVRNRNV